MAVLGLIPARGGSKGLPGKHTKALLGRPLLAWTADAALAARHLDRVVLSTDDAELAELGRSLGLDVPELRPAHLAGDDVPTLTVVQHVLDLLGGDVEAVCLLQATSPARPPGLVDRCVQALRAPATSVVSMAPVSPDHHPDWAWVEAADLGPGQVRLATGGTEPVSRRQELRPAYRRDGAVYVTRSEVIRGGSLYGDHVVAISTDPALAVSIDDLEDWPVAEAALRRLGHEG